MSLLIYWCPLPCVISPLFLSLHFLLPSSFRPSLIQRRSPGARQSVRLRRTQVSVRLSRLCVRRRPRTHSRSPSCGPLALWARAPSAELQCGSYRRSGRLDSRGRHHRLRTVVVIQCSIRGRRQSGHLSWSRLARTSSDSREVDAAWSAVPRWMRGTSVQLCGKRLSRVGVDEVALSSQPEPPTTPPPPAHPPPLWRESCGAP